MKRKVKFLSVIILLLSLIFLFLIRLNYPMSISKNQSIFHKTPTYYWILLITISALISITFILTKSKSVAIFLSVIFFFLMYSFNLFFVIPFTQTDVAHAGEIFYILRDSTTLSVDQFDYFQWPIHFVYTATIKETLNLGISTISLGLFSFIVTLPLFFSLFKDRLLSNKVYFLLPVGYIILSFYLLNLQWVPQFTGLVFLILTISCYFKYKKHPSRKIYSLIIIFYSMCVFTHPFIFVFFPATIFIDRYLYPKNYLHNSNEDKPHVSLLQLVVIYFIGYIFRFARMARHTRRLIFPRNGIGGSWELIGTLIGDDEAVGIDEGYETHLFYDLVSERTYLLSRYAALLLLLILCMLLAYILLKNLKKIESFDVSLGLASGGFFVFGLVNPALLGQRAFQITFLKLPKYYSYIFESKKKILAIVLILLITLAPFLFNLNRSVNQGLTGARLIQDKPTIESGRFVDMNVGNGSNVLVADRFFYPGSKDDINVYHPRYLAENEINMTEIDVIISSQKLNLRMEYYGVEENYRQFSQIYDMGEAQILIRNES